MCLISRLERSISCPVSFSFTFNSSLGFPGIHYWSERSLKSGHLFRRLFFFFFWKVSGYWNLPAKTILFLKEIPRLLLVLFKIIHLIGRNMVQIKGRDPHEFAKHSRLPVRTAVIGNYTKWYSISKLNYNKRCLEAEREFCLVKKKSETVYLIFFLIFNFHTESISVKRKRNKMDSTVWNGRCAVELLS